MKSEHVRCFQSSQRRSNDATNILHTTDECVGLPHAHALFPAALRSVSRSRSFPLMAALCSKTLMSGEQVTA